MNAGRLAGRRALVTGGASGIGLATARRLAAEGAHVAVNGRDEARGQQAVAAIREAGGTAVWVQAALDGTRKTCSDLVARAEEELGSVIDVLVNNAASVVVAETPNTSEQQLAELWAVNVASPFFLVAELAPAMAERGGGAIVNITSWMAQAGTRGVPAYSATKGALDALTRDWAAEFGPSGVRVNSVSPGVTRDRDDRQDPGWAAVVGTPHGRFVHPDQVAAAVAHLASDDAIGVHGVRLDVDGGRTATAVIAG